MVRKLALLLIASAVFCGSLATNDTGLLFEDLSLDDISLDRIDWDNWFTTRIVKDTSEEDDHPTYMYPYQAYLEAYNPQGKPKTCTGALISANHVITAAECVNGSRRVFLVFGINDLNNPEKSTVQARFSRKIQIHPYYDNNSRYNKYYDLAVIRVNSPVRFDSYVQPIAMPQLSYPCNDYYYRTSCPSCICWSKEMFIEDRLYNVSGWGTKNPYRNVPQNKLRSLEVYGTSFSTCYNKSSFDERVLCAVSYGAGSTCAGDEGAPLVGIVNSRLTLVGISIATHCKINEPMIFTSIYAYKNWVDYQLVYL